MQSIKSRWRDGIKCLIVTGISFTMGTGSLANPVKIITAADGWSVLFNEAEAQLELVHVAGGALISGGLTFVTGNEVWRIAAPRDAVPGRVALIDPAESVQGYISFQCSGDRLSLLVHHRTAQNYAGRLIFAGDTKFTAASFACCTRPLKGSRVIQFATGGADSRLNDSLFDPERDCALLFDAALLKLATQGDGRFGFDLSADIQQAGEAVMTFTLERNYYRTRWVPYYKPLDRTRCPKPPTGWMSWNTYFDTATADDNLAEARLGKQHLQPFGLEFWHIESWQDNSDKLPVSNFDNLTLTPNPRQFPLGMKRLADDIRELGFRPGLWTAPFGTGNTNFYLAHRAWFLHDQSGKPLRTWNGKFTIDPTHPEVIAHLREIHHVASHEWGYEFFKIDGMSGRNASYCAHFFERPDVRAVFKDPTCPNPFERCVAAFREGIGADRVFLACQGHFTGPEAAYADAARTGADIVHPNQPPKWLNLLNQARCTLNQVFVNNIVFFTDPDTLLVGEFLDIEQARLATTVVALPGQMMFAGDKLALLKPERMRLLQQALPVCDVRPLDLFPVFELLPVWVVHVRRPFAEWSVAALFNWDAAEASVGFSFEELGLDENADHVLYEFWSTTYQGIHKGRFEMRVPGHGVRLIAIHRKQEVPQYLGSDRHIVQGAVELTHLAWQATANSLAGKVKVVAGHPLTLRFRTPPGFTFGTAHAGDRVVCKVTAESAEVVALTLTSEVSQEVPFTLMRDHN